MVHGLRDTLLAQGNVAISTGMRPILKSQPGKNRFSHCYMLSSKVQVVDPNTFSEAGRLQRVDNKGYY